MSWNHRVIRTEDDGGPCYAIHECHYDKKGDTIPIMWTAEPTAVLSDTRHGLFWVLSVMTEAVGKPILEIDETGKKLREIEPAKELSDDLKRVLEFGKAVGNGQADPAQPF